MEPSSVRYRAFATREIALRHGKNEKPTLASVSRARVERTGGATPECREQLLSLASIKLDGYPILMLDGLWRAEKDGEGRRGRHDTTTSDQVLGKVEHHAHWSNDAFKLVVCSIVRPTSEERSMRACFPYTVARLSPNTLTSGFARRWYVRLSNVPSERSLNERVLVTLRRRDRLCASQHRRDHSLSLA